MLIGWNNPRWAHLPLGLTKEGSRAVSAATASARRVLVLFFVFFPVLASSLRAQTLRIAAASDLQFVFPDLAAQFEKESDVKLAISYGSSGSLFAQIQNGAPFDLFFSADATYPQKLVAAGSAEPGSYNIYAFGYLVIWLPPDSPFDLAAEGYRALLDPRLRKIAIADPEHAPYGQAAIAALHDAGIFDQVKGKLVFGENVSHAAQFVQSGAAQAGIISRSLALSPALKSGKRYELTGGRFTPLAQAAVVLRASANKKAANAFLAFLKTPSARTIFDRYGYLTPAASPMGIAQ